MIFIGTLLLIGALVGAGFAQLRGLPTLRNLALTLAILAVVTTSFVIIPAGQTGVVFSIFGGVKEKEMGEGLRLRVPFVQQVTLFSTRDQAVGFNQGSDDDITALSKEGLQISADATIRFRILADEADTIYQMLGRDYEGTLIRPQVRSVIRDEFAQYNAAEVISTRRAELQQGIKGTLATELERSNIELIDVLLRNIRIPDTITDVIEEKQTEEQRIQVEVNRREQASIAAERRIIDAKGQRDATIAVAEGEAKKLELQGQAIKDNPGIIQLEVAQRLAPGVQTVMLPSEGNFLLDVGALTSGIGQAAQQSAEGEQE